MIQSIEEGLVEYLAMEKKESRIPKPLLPFATLLSTAIAIFNAISGTMNLIDQLDKYGASGVLKGLVVPGLIAVVALIISVIYLRSYKQSQKSGADNAEGGLFARFFNALAKLFIALFILAVIACGVFGYMHYKDITQRPQIPITDNYDLAGAITGYNGSGKFVASEVEEDLLSDFAETFKKYDKHNQSGKQEISDEKQSMWSDFLRNIDIDCEDQDGLSNDSMLKVTVSYVGQEEDVKKLEHDLHIKIKELNKPIERPVGKIKKLPDRLSGAEQAASEKGDVIRAVAERLETDIRNNHEDLIDYSWEALFCTPGYSSDNEPDALVIRAAYSYYFLGDPNDVEKLYSISYIYPFDGRVDVDMLSDNSDRELEDGVTLEYEKYCYTNKDPDALDNLIRSGSLFNSSVNYHIEKIPVGE